MMNRTQSTSSKDAGTQPITLEERILRAFRDGQVTRSDLMAVQYIRIMTWAKVEEHLKDLVKRRIIVQTKAGWKLV